jgi:hypothetical protein
LVLEESYDGRITMVKLRHGVEEMSDKSRTASDGDGGDIVGSDTRRSKTG